MAQNILGDNLARAIQLRNATLVKITLHSIWCYVLGRENLPDTDGANFFALGGDSASAEAIISIARAAGVNLTPWLVFTYSGLREMAVQIMNVATVNPYIVQKPERITTESLSLVPLPVVEFWAEACQTEADNIEDVVILPNPQGELALRLIRDEAEHRDLELNSSIDINILPSAAPGTPTKDDRRLICRAWETVCRKQPNLRTRLVRHRDNISVALIVLKEARVTWVESNDRVRDIYRFGMPMVQQRLIDNDASRTLCVRLHPLIADFWSRAAISWDFTLCLNYPKVFERLPARHSHAHLTRHLNQLMRVNETQRLRREMNPWHVIFHDWTTQRYGLCLHASPVARVRFFEWSTPKTPPSRPEFVYGRKVVKEAITQHKLPATFKVIADGAWILALMRAYRVPAVMANFSTSARLLAMDNIDTTMAAGNFSLTLTMQSEVSPSTLVTEFLSSLQARQLIELQRNLLCRYYEDQDTINPRVGVSNRVVHSFFCASDLDPAGDLESKFMRNFTAQDQESIGSKESGLSPRISKLALPISDYRNVHSYLHHFVNKRGNSLEIELRVSDISRRGISIEEAISISKDWETIMDDMIANPTKNLRQILTGEQVDEVVLPSIEQ